MNYPQHVKERRVNRDRRRFTYTAYSPERRSGVDRRAQTNQLNAKVA